MAKQKPSLANLTLAKGATTAPVVQVATTHPDQEEKRIGQTLRLPQGAHKQLKHLATDLGMPVHDLLIEAVNDLFAKYGKPPIA